MISTLPIESTAKRSMAGPVPPSEAVEQTNKLCHEFAIPIQRRGKRRFLVGVRIKIVLALGQ
jgi:hypothetical protein